MSKSRSFDEHSREEQNLLLQVCERIHAGKRGQEVAADLQLSTAKVTRLKKEAQRLLLLRTVFYPPLHATTRQKLEPFLRKLGLRELIVCQRCPGVAAARYFEENASEETSIVLDGGATVREFTQAVRVETLRRLEVVPLCADPASYGLSAYALMESVVARFPNHAACVKLPYSNGPLLAKDHELARGAANSAEWIVLGAGPWRDQFTALEFVRHLGLDPRQLREEYPSVIGMCGYCPLNTAGGIVPIEAIDRIMPRALSFDAMRVRAADRNCHVVLMAAGKEKAQIVHLAIQAGLCNTLVIGQDGACAMLRHLEGSRKTDRPRRRKAQESEHRA